MPASCLPANHVSHWVLPLRELPQHFVLNKSATAKSVILLSAHLDEGEGKEVGLGEGKKKTNKIGIKIRKIHISN